MFVVFKILVLRFLKRFIQTVMIRSGGLLGPLLVVAFLQCTATTQLETIHVNFHSATVLCKCRLLHLSFYVCVIRAHKQNKNGRRTFQRSNFLSAKRPTSFCIRWASSAMERSTASKDLYTTKAHTIAVSNAFRSQIFRSSMANRRLTTKSKETSDRMNSTNCLVMIRRFLWSKGLFCCNLTEFQWPLCLIGKGI